MLGHTGAASAAVCRFIFTLHMAWTVNSAAHTFGARPYDANISPTENKLVSLFTLGEGFHNYHHAFPCDYGDSEWGYDFNLTTLFIDAMAAVGQVWGRRTVSPESVQRRIQRTGPGSSDNRKGKASR